MNEKFISLQSKNNSSQVESFLSLCRMVLVVLGAALYFSVMEQEKLNLWDIVIFVAGFYYSLQMVFQTYVMGQKVPGWLSALVDVLLVWLFFWPVCKGELYFLPVYYLNAIFISIRYELKGAVYGFVINAVLYLLGIYLFSTSLNSLSLLVPLSSLLAVSVMSGIIVARMKKTDAKKKVSKPIKPENTSLRVVLLDLFETGYQVDQYSGDLSFLYKSESITFSCILSGSISATKASAFAKAWRQPSFLYTIFFYYLDSKTIFR